MIAWARRTPPAGAAPPASPAPPPAAGPPRAPQCRAPGTAGGGGWGCILGPGVVAPPTWEVGEVSRAPRRDNFALKLAPLEVREDLIGGGGGPPTHHRASGIPGSGEGPGRCSGPRRWKYSAASISRSACPSTTTCGGAVRWGGGWWGPWPGGGRTRRWRGDTDFKELGYKKKRWWNSAKSSRLGGIIEPSMAFCDFFSPSRQETLGWRL